MKIWQGLSPFNGVPIFASLGAVKRPSKNSKTGDMAQLSILSLAQKPHDAVAAGQDRCVCGTCPLASMGGCYVNVAKAPNAQWRADHDEPVAPVPAIKKPVRLGSYGDPGFLPLPVVSEVVSKAQGHTGYTHQWRTIQPAYSAFLMASCDGDIEARDQAKKLGYRTARTLGVGDPGVQPGEIVCPAFGGKTTCATCGLCNGARYRTSDTRVDIVFPRHDSRSTETRSLWWVWLTAEGHPTTRRAALQAIEHKQ